jgi:hypothetical protein
MQLRAFVVVILALSPLAACDKPTTTTPEPVAPPTADPNPVAPVEPDAAPPTEATFPTTGEGTLDGLELGDRACYVQLDVDGTKHSAEGEFELCAGQSRDATPLVGKRVKWTTVRANVLAASCQGDVDCKQSDVVDLVETLALAGGTDVPVTLDTLDASNAEATLGKAASKSTETWGVDGGRYTTWKWRGIELITHESGSLQLVQCEDPCTLATAQGVKLGSTDAEVKKIHGDGINRRLSNKTKIIVGDEYGGTAFDLKGGKVVRIVVGSWAE